MLRQVYWLLRPAKWGMLFCYEFEGNRDKLEYAPDWPVRCELQVYHEHSAFSSHKYMLPARKQKHMCACVRRWAWEWGARRVSGGEGESVRSAGGSAAVCFWRRSPRPAASLGGLPYNLWGPCPGKPPPRTKGRRKSDSLPGILLCWTVHSPGRRSAGWAVYCLARDAAKLPGRRPPRRGSSDRSASPSLSLL